MAPHIKNRRQLRNFLLAQRDQFRYGMQFFFFAGVVVSAVQLVSYYAVRRAVFGILAEAGENGVLQSTIDSAIQGSLVRLAVIALPIGILALVLSTRIVHRMLGPVVPIQEFIGRLSAGEYGAECRPLRDSDEMHLIVKELNTLSHSLEERHGSPERRELREAGFSLIEVLVIVTVIGVLSMIAVSQTLIAYDRARQRATMGDMRDLAAANGTYALDNGNYAANLSDLEPKYMGQVVPVDRWGYAWSYTGAGKTYSLTSTGSDGMSGPAAPASWNGKPFEADLVLQNGSFTQAPTGIQ